jgi:hypothetical protein
MIDVKKYPLSRFVAKNSLKHVNDYKPSFGLYPPVYGMLLPRLNHFTLIAFRHLRFAPPGPLRLEPIPISREQPARASGMKRDTLVSAPTTSRADSREDLPF